METPSNIVTGGYTMEYGDVVGALNTADHVVQGRFKMGSQYHFHMETQTCIVTPVEDGFDLEVTSQDVNNTQHQVAAALGTSANSINITVKRLGGAYGAKITLPIHLATAGAVAANKTNKPVRIWMPLEDNMRMLGMRNHYLFDYKVNHKHLPTSERSKVSPPDRSLSCRSRAGRGVQHLRRLRLEPERGGQHGGGHVRPELLQDPDCAYDALRCEAKHPNPNGNEGAWHVQWPRYD